VKAELLHTFVADPRSVPVVGRLPDGGIVTGGADGFLRRWDPAHWIALSAVDAHGRGVRDLHVTDAQIISVGGDRSLRAWDAVEGRPLFAVTRRVAARIGPGVIAAISSRGRVCLHDPETGALVRRLPRLDCRVICLAFDPDGAGVVVGAEDGVHRLPLDGRAPARWAASGLVRAMDAGPDAICAIGDDAQVVAFDPSGRARWQVDGDGAVPRAVALSPDGRRVALSMAYQIQIRDMADGRVRCEIKSRLKGLFGLAWSADGQRVCCGAADGRVRVWAIG